MLKLDLKETEVTAGLVLAAVVADQTASSFGLDACVQGLSDSLTLTVPAATDVLRQVFAAHLSRRLGLGFTVSEAEDGLVTVALDMAEDPVDVAPEAAETFAADVQDPAEDNTVEPEAADEELAVGPASPEIGSAPRRRGRPPGSKTRHSEP